MQWWQNCCRFQLATSVSAVVHTNTYIYTDRQTDRQTHTHSTVTTLHSRDNVKFLDNSLILPWWFAALLRGIRHVKCYSYHHIMPVLVINTCMDANMHLTINSYKYFSLTFPWFLVKSLTFPWQLSNSLTFPGVPDKRSPWHSHRHLYKLTVQLIMLYSCKFTSVNHEVSQLSKTLTRDTVKPNKKTLKVTQMS